MMAYSIAEQLDLRHGASLILVDQFSGAAETHERILKRTDHAVNFRTEFVKDRQEALNFCRSQRINSIYVDSDVGIRNYIGFLGLRRSMHDLHLNVYEEGLGTYRDDIYSRFRKKILGSLGVGTVFGGCRLTESIFVCCPEEYERKMPPRIAKKSIRIAAGIMQTLDVHSDFWEYIFQYDGVRASSSRKCSLYLSGWEMDMDFLSHFSTLAGDKYIKPHPHIRGAISHSCGELIGKSAPAEIVLSDLARNYEEVEVFHHGSSCQRYMTADNIRFELIG